MKKLKVVAAVINYEGKTLCCQRKTHKFKYLSKKWEFPGGKIEEGETEEAALKREINEELELTINDLKHFVTVKHCYDDFEIEMATYLANTTKPDFKLHDHVQAKWCNLNDLKNFDWAEADVPIVEKLLKKI